MTVETHSRMDQVSDGEKSGKGRLVVLAGPSAVGKSTVIRQVRETLPDLYFSVSVTTRKPRPGEVDGRDYFFVTADQFSEYISNDALLEWADIHGGLQRSGTPRQPVEEALSAGRPVLVEVDLAGVRHIKETMPEAYFVFLSPPSWDDLVTRLTNRGTEPPDVIDRRLTTAKEELAAQGEFDRIIVNDDVTRAAAELVSCWQHENN